jgi:hypothetical protein
MATKVATVTVDREAWEHTRSLLRVPELNPVGNGNGDEGGMRTKRTKS